MSVRSAQSITRVFTTRAFSTGAAANADSLPTGTLYVNGTADAATVTVTNITTGVYKAQVTLPTLAVGDVVDLRISATVSSVADNAVIWSDTKDMSLDSSGRALSDVDTIKTNPVVNAGTVTFPTGATLASTTNITSATGVDVTKWSGTTVASPATAGIPEINVKNINNVSASSVTTVNANQGTTQPINFTGTGASALAKSDMVDVAGAAVSASTAQIGVNVVNFGGSAGTFSGGRPEVNTTHIRGTSSAGAVGYVGIDWNAINAPATTVNLSGTTISTSQGIASVSGAVGSVTGNVGGNVVGSVASVTNAVTLSSGDSPVMQSGTATAGGASTITIQTALGADSLPVGSTIKITGGTGAKQARVITGYVDATKVATVDRAWVTNPDATSVYSILYAEQPKLDSSLKIQGVVLADTITTYTGNTVQTGDSFARIGNTGSGLTSLAPSSTALSTATWTGSLATNIATTNSTVATNLDATVSSRMATYTQPTGFLAATFPSTVASTTNITAATGIDVTKINGTSIAGTGTRVADSFVTMFNVASPVMTVASVNQTGDNYAKITDGSYGLAQLVRSTTPANTLSVDSGHLVAVPNTQKVDVNTIKTNPVVNGGTVTFPTDATIGTSTLEQAQITGGAYTVQSASCVLGDERLQQLDAAISSRGTSTLTQSQVTGGAYSLASSSATLGDTRIANLDAAVSSRSTYSGADTSGTTTLLSRVSSSRAGYLDNLNVGGNVASSAEVSAIQNNTRTVIVVPATIERPDSGTDTYLVHLYLYDEVGNMEAPDSAPTVTLLNSAGTDRSGRLDSTTGTLVATGHYKWTYTNTSTDTLEQLLWQFAVVEGGATRYFGRDSLVVDTTAVDFTSSDRTKLTAVYDKLPVNNIADETLVLASIDDVKAQTDQLSFSSGYVLSDLRGIVGHPVAVDTGTAGTISFLSGEYVAVTGGTVQANVTQIDGENIVSDGNGRQIVKVEQYYDYNLDSYANFPPNFTNTAIDSGTGGVILTATQPNEVTFQNGVNVDGDLSISNTLSIGNQITVDSSIMVNGDNLMSWLGSVKTTTDQFVFTVANQVDANAVSGGGSGLDAAGVRSAIGMSSPNLDTQLSGIQSDTDNIQTRIPAALTSDGNMKSDSLKINGAAPNNVAATDIVSGGAITTSSGRVSRVTLVDTTTTNTDMRGTDNAALASLWTSARAGYMDNLSGGAVMLASSYSAPPSASTISTQVGSDLSAAHGSGSWATATGFSTLDAAGVRTAVGLASANLDTQIASVQSDTDNIQTRLPSSLTAAGNMKADSLKLNGATPNNVAATDIVSSGAITTLSGAVVNVDTVDVITTYTGNTPQTGDSFARIGAAGSGLTNIDLPDQTMNITGNITGNLVGTVSTVTTLTNLPTMPADWITASGLSSGATSEISAAIMAATGDTGVSLEKAIEMLAAFIAGKVSVSSSGGISTYSYKRRDGTTTSFTSVCSQADGTRATTGSLS